MHLERIAAERVGAHDDGILAVVGLVATADAHAVQTGALVEGDGALIGNPRLEGNDPAAALQRGVDGGGEEQLAEAAPPVGLANGDGGDVGLVTQEPDADVADEELARGRWWLFAEPATKAVAQAAEEAWVARRGG